MAKMSENTKLILVAAGIVAVGVGGIVIATKLKNKRWGKGKKQKKFGDEGFNPKTEIKVAYVGEQGYANIRTTPELKSSKGIVSLGGLWDSWTMSQADLAKKYVSQNFLGKVSSGKIGVVQTQQKGEQGHLWFKVKLANPIKGKSYGWVREDVVRLKIEKK